MTPEEIRVAIMDRTVASWATLSPVAFPNHDFNSTGATAWMRLTIKMGDSVIGELGCDGVGWRSGIVMMSIFVPANTGLRKSMKYAERAEVLYRRKCLNGVIFDEPNTREIGIDSGWYQTMVTVDFQTLIGE